MTIDAMIPITLWMATCMFGCSWLLAKGTDDKDLGHVAGFIVGAMLGFITCGIPCWILSLLGATIDLTTMDMLNGGTGIGGIF